MGTDNVTILEQRIAEWVVKLGVESRLNGGAHKVTQRLHAFLDRGIVGLVFVGHEISDEFFKAACSIASRAASPRPRSAPVDRPAGTLRLNVPASAARLVLPAILPGFLAAWARSPTNGRC